MPDLHLLRPLWLLALPPLVLLWVLLVRQASQQRRWQDLIDPHLRDAVLTGERDAAYRKPIRLLAIGWLLLVVALAGPVWRLESRPLYRIEQARVLLLDLTEHIDRGIEGPERLRRARFEAMDLLRAADEGQLALIGYADEPFLIAPLTSDAGTILEQVPVLAPDLLPVAGLGRTDLALEMAAALLQRSGAAQGDVILIATALERPQLALAAARRLRDAGHRLSVLAVADASASKPGGESSAGQALVQEPPQRQRLLALARAGGGILVDADYDDADTRRLLALPGERRISPSGDRIATAGQWRDQGYWLLLLALPIAAVAFRRGWLGLLPLAWLVMPPAPAQALSWQDLWLRPEQQAFRALQRDPAPAVGERFADPRWRAAAFYRAGQYEQALDALAGRTDLESRYNRGNTLARLRRYDEAIAEYDAALLMDPEHVDARHNRDLLLRLVDAPLAAVAEPPGPRADDASTDEQARDRSVPESAREREGAAGRLRAGSADPTMDGLEGGLEDGSANGGGAAPSMTAANDGGAQAPGVVADESGADDRDADSGGAFVDAAPAAIPGATPGSTPGASDTVTGDPGLPREPAMSAAGFGLADHDPAAIDRDSAATGQDPVDYWLRQVPDAPEGLLRERLMLQYLRRHGQLR